MLALLEQVLPKLLSRLRRDGRQPGIVVAGGELELNPGVQTLEHFHVEFAHLANLGAHEHLTKGLLIGVLVHLVQFYEFILLP